MNLFKFSSLSFLFLFSFALVTPAFAATTPPAVKTTTAVKPITNVVVLATVNIQNAKIVSQKDNIFNISFALTNGPGVQSGVKYGVELVSTDPKNQFVVDEKVYSESLTLVENSNISKDITYEAPKTLSDKYKLQLTIQNQSGFIFGRVPLGEVTLKSSGEGLLISPSSCYLQVVGEKDSPHYNIQQGIDIAKNENVTLTCNIINSTKNSVTVKPIFETFLQSAYGAVTPTAGGSIDAITIASKENKTFTVTLPVASNPQVYSVNVKLAEGNTVSNTVNASYMIRGETATILNLSLDKDSYNKGDNSVISLIYISMSNNTQGRVKTPDTAINLKVKATILNDKGQECIEPINQVLVLGNSPKVEIPATITKDCVNPKVSVTLLDDKGNVLDQKDFLTKSGSNSTQTQTTTPAKSNNIIIIFIIGFLIVAGAAYYFINLKKKQNEIINK